MYLKWNNILLKIKDLKMLQHLRKNTVDLLILRNMVMVTGLGS